MYIENKEIKKNISIWLIFMFFLISFMIIVGGLTRLTDSGLSITKWQLFSGFLPPFTATQWDHYFNLYKEIPEFKLQNYSMNLEEFKVIFWWEWAHRFLGRIIGLFYLVPLIYFSFKVKINKIIDLYLIFFLICFQGFIGWYMVSSGLVDRVDVSHYRLSVHLLIAFFIISLIFWNYLKLSLTNTSKEKLNLFFPVFLLILIFFQISIGAFVSGMDAGKIYNSWPLMGSSYFPNDSSYIDLFKLSAFDEPSLVQFLHRNLAYFICIYYLYIVINIYKKKLFSLYFSIKLIGSFLLIQIILGILTLLYGAQIILASMHQISSIFLVSSCIYFLFLNSKSNLQL
jgi:cytochrome c oxidase assembly protein subunit 15